MSDSYLGFANSLLGSRIANLLGLPQPLPLERYHGGAAVLEGSVLVGTAGEPELLAVLARCFKSMGVASVAHRSAPQWVVQTNAIGSMSGRWGVADQPGEKVKALVLDATGLSDSTQSEAVYQFFHDAARSVLSCGRVIVLGRPAQDCAHPRQATVQRALEGLTRSLGKELKHGITVQLVYVARGSEACVESTLRFLLSPRSAYVSGQVIHISRKAASVTDSMDWSQPMAGQRVLVTGASRGIGAAIAQTMVRDGAQVICLDVPQAQAGLDEISARLGTAQLALDIGAPDAPEALVRAALAHGGWDVVVHNAGITRDKTIAKMQAHQWQSVVNINLSAQERINDALVASAALRAGGRIVCVSSISGIAGNLGQTNYALSKAGVIGMVQSMAPVLAAKGITINAVAPGFIETQMTAAVPFALREAGRRLNSLGQGGQPVDVAEAIAWLASPASQGLTGNVLRVCGQSLLGA